LPYQSFSKRLPANHSADIYEVQTSCGFSVQLYGYEGERDWAQKWTENKERKGLKHISKKKTDQYRRIANSVI